MGIICSRSDDVLDLSSFCFLPFTPKLMIRKEGVQVASFLTSLTLGGRKRKKGESWARSLLSLHVQY